MCPAGCVPAAACIPVYTDFFLTRVERLTRNRLKPVPALRARLRLGPNCCCNLSKREAAPRMAAPRNAARSDRLAGGRPVRRQA